MIKLNILRRVMTCNPSRLCIGVSRVPLGTILADEAASDWFVTPQNEVRLISANQGVSGDKIVRLGLQIKLKKGWKVYWRTPVMRVSAPDRLDAVGKLGESKITLACADSFRSVGISNT